MAVRAALLGVVLLAGGGCFRPKIASGGFKCDMTKGENPCPDNFRCENGLCVTPSTDGGTDMAKGGNGGGAGGHAGTGGIGGKGGTAGGSGGTGGDAGPCLPQVASCDAGAAGVCDPVCNARCGDCHDKCSLSSRGVLACNLPSVATTASTQTACTLKVVGDAGATTDNCAPGNSCIDSECGAVCFQFCRANSDCNNASCSRDAGAGYKACDVPFNDTCDPIAGAQIGCPFSGQGCYLSANTARTLCDCPFNGTTQGGGLSVGQTCSHSRQCGIGLACYDVLGRGNPQCVAVCRLPGDAGTPRPGERVCPSGCLPFLQGGPNYGYCLN